MRRLAFVKWADWGLSRAADAFGNIASATAGLLLADAQPDWGFVAFTFVTGLVCLVLSIALRRSGDPVEGGGE